MFFLKMVAAQYQIEMISPTGISMFPWQILESHRLDHDEGASFVNVEFVGSYSIPADELAKNFSL